MNTTRILAVAARWSGLAALGMAVAGCPPPPPPPQEPLMPSDDFTVPEPTAEPEPEEPPEAGEVKLGPAIMTGGAGMSNEARQSAKEAFIASFNQGMHHFRRCYAPALQRNAELEGGVDVEVVLKPDGSIYEVKLVSAEIEDPALVRCVVKAFRKLSYQPLQDGELFSATAVVKLSP